MTTLRLPRKVKEFCKLALGSMLLMAMPFSANATEDPWPELHRDLFANKPLAENDGTIVLYAPGSAENAALVPISMRIPSNIAGQAKTLSLIIDRNPAPVAAVFKFGEGYSSDANIGERTIATRIRIDSFSKVRAILETTDGKLHMVSKFVAGAGGCSSPAGSDVDAALAGLGRTQVKSLQDKNRGESWREGIVMVRHPNFTGMQMDAKTRNYTPARFVNRLMVSKGEKLVFEMEGGISISEDPNIRFTYDGTHNEPLAVTGTDTEGATFSGSTHPNGS